MLEKRYLLSHVAITLLASLAVASMPVQASPMVRIYVDMPLGYIPGVPSGNPVFVDLYIDTDILDNTPQGIAQWVISVKVNPSVLEPMGVQGAQTGYFLYDFLVRHGYNLTEYMTVVLKVIDKATGEINELCEGFLPNPPTGAGAVPGQMPYKLCTLIFKSLSETAYSPIDLHYEIGVDAWYMTAESRGEVAFPVDVVEDGQYNLPSPPPVPEFPLGSVAPIALIVAVAYVWLVKKQGRPKVMCSRKKTLG